MARLENYKCPTHGDVYAKDHRWGPCPKCEAEVLDARLDKALKTVATFDADLIFRAEIETLRAMLVQGKDAEAVYWERVATYLQKNDERMLAHFTRKKT